MKLMASQMWKQHETILTYYVLNTEVGDQVAARYTIGSSTYESQLGSLGIRRKRKIIHPGNHQSFVLPIRNDPQIDSKISKALSWSPLP